MRATMASELNTRRQKIDRGIKKLSAGIGFQVSAGKTIHTSGYRNQ
jgi:hypothetical protein